MKKIKVLFLVESLAIAAGGTALEVVNLSAALSADPNLEVVILTVSSNKILFDVAHNVIVKTISRSSLFSSSYLRNLGIISTLLSSCDVCFVTGVWGPVDGLAFRLAKTKRLSYYVRVCGMLEPYIRKRNWFIKKAAWFLYVKPNLLHASGIVVNSESERSRLLRLIGRNRQRFCHVIKNGLNPPPSLPSNHGLGGSPERDESIHLLYLGRIHPKKGLHILLDALLKLCESKSGRSFHLTVAGEYSDEQYRSQVLHASSLLPSQSVSFVGLVSGDDKERLFARADLFVLPSYSEGLPNSICEALVRGVPVLITEGCNFPEVLDYRAGFVVQPSPESIADILLDISRPGFDFSSMRKSARKLSADVLSVDKMFKAYTDLVYSCSGAV